MDVTIMLINNPVNCIIAFMSGLINNFDKAMKNEKNENA